MKVLKREETADFAECLDRMFPDWRLIEIFGPPGSGKTYLCEQLVGVPGVLTSANHRGLHFYASRNQWRATRAVLPFVGQKLAKNYYGLKSRLLEKEVLRWLNNAERDFLSDAITLVDVAPMHERTRDKIKRSILRSTGLTVCCRSEGIRLALDEGLVRRLIDIYWRMKVASAPTKYFDLIKVCLEEFPFERNALAVSAPPDLCVSRQALRRQIIASADKPQIVFHDATDAIAEMCEQAGWRTVALENY